MSIRGRHRSCLLFSVMELKISMYICLNTHSQQLLQFICRPLTKMEILIITVKSFNNEILGWSIYVKSSICYLKWTSWNAEHRKNLSIQNINSYFHHIIFSFLLFSLSLLELQKKVLFKKKKKLFVIVALSYRIFRINRQNNIYTYFIFSLVKTQNGKERFILVRYLTDIFTK